MVWTKNNILKELFFIKSNMISFNIYLILFKNKDIRLIE